MQGSSAGAIDHLVDLSQEIVATQDAQAERVAEYFAETQHLVPPFDHLRDFWTNFAAGPRLNGSEPRLFAPASEPTRLLDFELNLPFGVPACALTPHAGFVDYFAARGFDLLTYKTVRDRPWNPHPFPQWGFATDAPTPVRASDLLSGELANPIVATLDPATPAGTANTSLVNSFGVPSLPVQQWQADVEASRATLSRRQALIVSVMGSPDAPDTKTDSQLVRQFAQTTGLAVEAGADMVELNLSCPNTGGELICRNAPLSASVVQAAYDAAGGTPVLIKTSYLPAQKLDELITACQRWMRGVVAINTVSASVVSRSGSQFFPKRPKAGVSGPAILELGLETTQRLAEIRRRNRAETDWVIIGVGGVTSPATYQAYRDEGADAVQSCSGAWLNPGLAQAIRESIGNADPAPGAMAELDRERVVVLEERQQEPATEPEKDDHRVLDAIGRFSELLATGGLSTRKRRR
jgi:dihydroorotate dehydrogenase